MLTVDDFDPADVADAIKRYNDNYDFLYENIDCLPDCLQTALTNAGDMAIKHNREFASVFCAMRGDLMSSDREAAAFAMTFPHLVTLETSC